MCVFCVFFSYVGASWTGTSTLKFSEWLPVKFAGKSWIVDVMQKSNKLYDKFWCPVSFGDLLSSQRFQESAAGSN